MEEHFFLYNDEVYPSDHAVINAGSRALRYGDGLFETMKLTGGRIINKEFHFERLFSGLSLLQFEVPGSFTAPFLEKQIKKLVAQNRHGDVIRIRLMVFRGNGGIFDLHNLLPNYIIETFSLPKENGLNKHGLVVDVFPGSRKSCDLFSNIKSNNHLPYVMAALFAPKNNLDDCVILNSFERICDSTIANVFIIKGEVISTPPLSEGCIAGVMRRWMLEKFSKNGYTVIQANLTINDLMDADEFFLTNAISHIRWVEKFRDKAYGNKKILEIHGQIIQTI